MTEDPNALFERRAELSPDEVEALTAPSKSVVVTRRAGVTTLFRLGPVGR
ncbi:MAG: hypothetical protein KC731_15610 [Myxococcales bacterium]|nr:hypothetical protein [Myxococcales bacterium]